MTTDDFKARAGRTDDILVRVAAMHESVRYLELGDVFCSQYACAIQDENGLPLYVDDDHISRTTAETLLPAKLSEIWTPGEN